MKYTLDSEPVDLAEFIEVNDFDEDELSEIAALKPGAEMLFGGGAAAAFVLRCVAN